MARKKLAIDPLRAAADARVTFSKQGSMLMAQIAISQNFTYPTPDCSNPGLYMAPKEEPDAGETFGYEDEEEDEAPPAPTGQELPYAQGALIRRLNAEMASPEMLRAWMRAALSRRGDSLPQLVADILGLPLDKATRNSARYKSESRALQRFRPGAKLQQHAKVSQERASRLVAFALKESRLRVAVLADWRFSRKYWPCARAGWQGPMLAPAVDTGGVESASYEAIRNRRGILSVVLEEMNKGPGTPAEPEYIKGYALEVVL